MTVIGSLVRARPVREFGRRGRGKAMGLTAQTGAAAGSGIRSPSRSIVSSVWSMVTALVGELDSSDLARTHGGIMHLGLGMHFQLIQEPRLEHRLALECRVCRQFITEDGRRVGELAGLAIGPASLGPSCRQPAPFPKDRNYRARARRFLARRTAVHDE